MSSTPCDRRARVILARPRESRRAIGGRRDAAIARSGTSRPAWAAAALLTQVPIGSPAMARSMFPSFLKLNTRIGRSLSRHMPMAVMSMTLSSSRRTWS